MKNSNELNNCPQNLKLETLDGTLLNENELTIVLIFYSGGSKGTLPARAHSMDQNFFNFPGLFRKSKRYIGSGPLSK